MGKRKDSKTLSVVKINLASHAEDDGSDPFTAEFKFKKSKNPANFVVLFCWENLRLYCWSFRFQLVAKTQWLKVNDKPLNEDTNAKVDGKDSDSGGDLSDDDREKDARKVEEEEDEGSVELSVLCAQIYF